MLLVCLHQLREQTVFKYFVSLSNQKQVFECPLISLFSYQLIIKTGIYTKPRSNWSLFKLIIFDQTLIKLK